MHQILAHISSKFQGNRTGTVDLYKVEYGKSCVKFRPKGNYLGWDVISDVHG